MTAQTRRDRWQADNARQRLARIGRELLIPDHPRQMGLATMMDFIADKIEIGEDCVQNRSKLHQAYDSWALASSYPRAIVGAWGSRTLEQALDEVRAATALTTPQVARGCDDVRGFRVLENAREPGERRQFLEAFVSLGARSPLKD